MFVTLLTDFGLEDEYVGVMKGVILGINPSATLVDLSHQVPPGDVRKAGWLLAWSWPYFPKGTVHLVVVDPGVGSSRRILCLGHRGHTFLAPDNGVLTPLLAAIRRPAIYSVENRRYALGKISDTFHGRDIFAPAAGYLSKGLSASRLGPRVKAFKVIPMRGIKQGSGFLEGRVIGFDRFGNAVTNLPADKIQRLLARGKIKIRIGRHLLKNIHRSYEAVAPGTALAVIGSHDLLEIAVYRGSAKRRLHLTEGESVRVAG
ncbi:MAG: SAM-dependent chlorinase/fluorinase [Candidatus Omnitrophica bacterium]|nr:SAM-dependent chlorinase/fluorinase [Candidatus Omnitrophota bacterium]